MAGDFSVKVDSYLWGLFKNDDGSSGRITEIITSLI